MFIEMLKPMMVQHWTLHTRFNKVNDTLYISTKLLNSVMFYLIQNVEYNNQTTVASMTGSCMHPSVSIASEWHIRLHITLKHSNYA